MKLPKALGFADQHLNIAGHKIPAWVILAGLAVISIILVRRAGSGVQLGSAPPALDPSASGADVSGLLDALGSPYSPSSQQQVPTGIPGPTAPYNPPPYPSTGPAFIAPPTGPPPPVNGDSSSVNSPVQYPSSGGANTGFTQGGYVAPVQPPPPPAPPTLPPPPDFSYGLNALITAVTGKPYVPQPPPPPPPSVVHLSGRSGGNLAIQ